MNRLIILLGYTCFIAYLHISGKLANYINLKYSYISMIAVVGFSILTVVELIRIIRKRIMEKKGIVEEHIHHGHDHGDGFGEQTMILENGEKVLTLKQEFIYWIFSIPVILGLLLPIATLDSNIVATKGFHFPFSDAEAGDFKNQFLKPDSSMYFSQEAYKKRNLERYNEIKSEKMLNLNDENYLRDMEVVYNNMDKFQGKEVEFNGFVFNDSKNDKQYVFVLRFGIIHCIADSGVYGFLVELPKNTSFKDDTWLHIKGKVDQMYYPSVKGQVPLIKAEKIEKVKSPKSPYVYMKY